MMRKFASFCREYQWPFFIVVLGRLGLFLLAYASLAFMPEYNRQITPWELFGDNYWLNGWARWDAGWYKDIAELGYAVAPRFDEQRNVVFFPLYPYAVRILRNWTHHTGVAGLIVSNVSFVVAMLFLYALVKRLYSVDTAKMTLVFASVFPFSFYFSALYSEALFFALVVGSFFFAHRSQWAMAAFLAAGASAARFLGITMVVALAVLYLEQIEFQVRRIRPNILWIAFAPMGLVVYALYLNYYFGDPLLFVTARNIEAWGIRDLSTTLAGLSTLVVPLRNADYLYVMDLYNLLVSVVALVPVAICWRRLPKAYVVWTLLYSAIVLVANWSSMGRYMTPIFPIYLAAALVWTRTEVIYSLIYLSTLALALLTVLYTHWYWVT